MSKHFINTDIVQYVSLDVAEKKISEIENKYKQELNTMEQEFAKFVNKVKHSYSVTGDVMYGISYGMDDAYKIGIPTGLKTASGVELFTGDEVSWLGKFGGGKKGFIGKSKDGKIMYVTNREIATISDKMSEIQPNNLIIDSHYFEHKNGDEIAKGRKGHKGFIVKIEESEGEVK